MAHLSGPRRVRIFVVVKITTIKTLLSHVSSSCDTKCIKLGIEIGLGLDEGAAIVSHRLVSRVRIFREYSVTGSDKHHHQED